MERIGVAELGNAWAKEKAHGPHSAPETLKQFIREDLGVEATEIWRCGMCGLEQARPLRAWSASHYPLDKAFLSYDHFCALEVLKACPPCRLLEIGCADGLFLRETSKLGHRPTGIDFSSEDIAQAQAQGLDARAADVGELCETLGSDRFQVICMFQIVEHLTDPAQVFEGIRRVAAPGAKLFVGCPSPKRFGRHWPHPGRLGACELWDYPPQHTLRWTANAFQAFFSRMGWSVDRIAYEPFTIIGSAAFMASSIGRAEGWYERAWKRRWVTAQWMLRALAARMHGRLSGVRMFVEGHLEGA